MPIDPVTVGLAGASMIGGKNANNKARKEADAAGRTSQALEQRMTKLWDIMFARAQQAEAGGEFDPEKRIAALETDTARYESKDLGNLSGAMRTFGYKKGDSEVGNRLDAVKTKYRSYLDSMRNEIRNNAWFDQQRAYQSVGDLSGPMQNANNRQANARGRIQSPAMFLQNFLPAFRGTGGGQTRGFNTRRPATTTI